MFERRRFKWFLCHWWSICLIWMDQITLCHPRRGPLCDKPAIITNSGHCCGSALIPSLVQCQHSLQPYFQMQKTVVFNNLWKTPLYTSLWVLKRRQTKVQSGWWRETNVVQLKSWQRPSRVWQSEQWEIRLVPKRVWFFLLCEKNTFNNSVSE